MTDRKPLTMSAENELNWRGVVAGGLVGFNLWQIGRNLFREIDALRSEVSRLREDAAQLHAEKLDCMNDLDKALDQRDAARAAAKGEGT